jgi:hypothetical protein
METTHFKKFIHLIDYFNHFEYRELEKKQNDNFYTEYEQNIFGIYPNKITILVSTLSKDIIKEGFDYAIYRDNFENELENNLLLSQSLEQKAILLKRYLSIIKAKNIIFEFQLKLRIEEDKYNIDNDIFDKSIPTFYETLNDFDKYVSNCYLFYFILFNRIYEWCVIIKINYHDLLEELSIEDYFNFDKVDNQTPLTPEPIEPEILDNYGFSVKQRFYLLVKTGLLEAGMFKGSEISQGAKHKLLAKILSCDVRTAKGMFNNEISYQMSIENQKEIEKLYNKITNNKDL